MQTASHDSESRQAAVVTRKADSGGKFSKDLLTFLSPEICANAGNRALYPNSSSRAACPIYQKGVIETNTLDIGDHQNRSILIVPHVACPVLLSHASLADVAGYLFQSSTVRGGRLSDPTTGRYGGNRLMPLFSSHEIPSHVDFIPGASVAIPIHGTFYTYTDQIGASAARSPTSVMFTDWTEVLNAGVGTGINAIPARPNDSVRLLFSCRMSGAAWIDGDLVMDVVTSDSAGVLTTTSGNLTGSLVAGGNTLAAVALLPAGSVGITSVSIRCVNARAVDFLTLAVNHNSNSAVSDVSTGLGKYVGTPISGLSALTPAASAARVTALSLKVTNTASNLNANGFIIGFATQDCYPGNTGCYGENNIAGLVSAKSYKFVDGSYMALSPSLDLPFQSLDSLPRTDTCMGMYVIQSQDNTPITMKLEYHTVIEVVSQDPLFAPEQAAYNPEFLAALKGTQESGGYLVLSENPFHWGSIGNFLEKAKKAVTSGPAKWILGQADRLGVPMAHAALMGERALEHLGAKKKSKAKTAAKSHRTKSGVSPEIRRIEQMLEHLPASHAKGSRAGKKGRR